VFAIFAPRPFNLFFGTITRRSSASSIQSDLGREIYRHNGLNPADAQTFLLLSNGKLFVRSDAAIEVASRLGGAWKLFAIFRFVPRGIRDGLYSAVARHRYRWFGRNDTCMVPSPEASERFVR
jgi:predicted DCC family thiol-disulfide oxidoreductase YuxK